MKSNEDAFKSVVPRLFYVQWIAKWFLDISLNPLAVVFNSCSEVICSYDATVEQMFALEKQFNTSA